MCNYHLHNIKNTLFLNDALSSKTVPSIMNHVRILYLCKCNVLYKMEMSTNIEVLLIFMYATLINAINHCNMQLVIQNKLVYCVY